MRIEKIASTKYAETLGLKRIELVKKRLGAVVALVGKNGAGKSRILKVVENYPFVLAPNEFLEGYINFVPDKLLNRHADSIAFAKQNYDTSKLVDLTVDQKENLQITIESQLKGFLHDFNENYRKYVKVVDQNDLTTIKDSLDGSITFEDMLNNDYAKINTLDKYDHNYINEFKLFNSNETIKYILELSRKDVLNKFSSFVSSDDSAKTFSDGKGVKPDKFSRFRHFIKLFLGKEFSYLPLMEDEKIKSTLTLSGKKFDAKLLSPGQKTLFAYAVLLFYLEQNTNSNIKDSIIIIDEPERHLHPEAQVLLINILREIIKEKGQLWIATHSINILSCLQSDEILFVDNDEISPPSRLTPGNSLNALMGYESNIYQLKDFISSTYKWAYANFMGQCFTQPDVVLSNDTKDPQYVLFKSFISQQNHINILDYGAGVGRMGYIIDEDIELRNKVIYNAYEPDSNKMAELQKVPNVNNYTSDINSVSNDSIDLVLLCNVLHEIHPRDWERVFENIRRVLKSKGFLLIMEDRYLPKGEDAHEFGYLILGLSQLKELFSNAKLLQLMARDEKYADRLVLCAIRKEDVSVRRYTIRYALESLNKEVYSDLKKIRDSKDKNLASGRQYANLTQLFINSKMALESI